MARNLKSAAATNTANSVEPVVTLPPTPIVVANTETDIPGVGSVVPTPPTLLQKIEHLVDSVKSYLTTREEAAKTVFETETHFLLKAADVDSLYNHIVIVLSDIKGDIKNIHSDIAKVL